MANMDYCKYENTLRDLRQCYDDMNFDPESESEIKAKERLINLCKKIAEDYTD